jgi:hypothetical protein
MKRCSYEKYFLKSALLLGWIAGCFPAKNPLRKQREFKSFSFIFLYSWAVFFLNFGVCAQFMVSSFNEQSKKQTFSDFVLIYIVIIFYYVVDLVARLISLESCGKFIQILNFIDEENTFESERKSIFFFFFILFTAAASVLKRALELYVNYNAENSFWVSGSDTSADVSGLLSDALINLRAVYVFAITMVVGLELLQCYEQFCTEFKVTCLYGKGSGTKIESLANFYQRFVKLQKMFDIYQKIGGNYALLTAVNSASDFIYYVYHSFTGEADRNAVSMSGVIETALVLYCFAFLGNRLEVKVNFICLKLDIALNGNQYYLKIDHICLNSDEGNESRATHCNGRVSSQQLWNY